MKILIDTNVFIPLEPTSNRDITPNTHLAAKLSQVAIRSGTQLWLHPAQRVDLAQDASTDRRTMREALFSKYPVLNLDIPAPPRGKTNQWVDVQLVECLKRNAVQVLVTEDRDLTKRAQAIAGSDRVVTLADAILMLETLVERSVTPPPLVDCVPVYTLSIEDPFWQSFCNEYPEFPAWFAKCQAEHRLAWVIRDPDSDRLIGATIVNQETGELKGVKTLKICSFKVDQDFSGRRYGELLLKAIFQYAVSNHYDTLFVTAFPTHQPLIGFLKDCGFSEEQATRTTGELSFVKQISTELPLAKTENSLAWFLDHGPYTLDLLGCKIFVVPILPVYHSMLFPEIQIQMRLLQPHHASGNALRKVYISRSAILDVKPGDILLFYRSQDEQSVRTWGVVESTMRSSNAEEIRGFVLPRTVYSGGEIDDMCQAGSVLAIMFRQCLRVIEPPLSLEELRSEGVIAAAPQSICSVSRATAGWLIERCKKPF